MFWFFGPILCYFILLVYAGSGWYGEDQENLLYEYLVIISWYYQVLIAYVIFKKIKMR